MSPTICPHCNRRFLVSDEAREEPLNCPGCQKTFSETTWEDAKPTRTKQPPPATRASDDTPITRRSRPAHPTTLPWVMAIISSTVAVAALVYTLVAVTGNNKHRMAAEQRAVDAEAQLHQLKTASTRTPVVTERPNLTRPKTNPEPVFAKPPVKAPTPEPEPDRKPPVNVGTIGPGGKVNDEFEDQLLDKWLNEKDRAKAAKQKMVNMPVIFTYPTPTPKPKTYAVPGYYKRTSNGFTLFVSDEAHEQSDKLNGQPLGCLEAELQTIMDRLPAATTKQLARVPIWVEWDHVIPGNTDVLAVYFGDEGEGLAVKGVDANKAKSICVMTLKNVYLVKSRDVMPTTILLHELAHAVHDQILGFDNPVVANAFKQAQTKGLYENVKHTNGLTRNGYATKNRVEYFAELSTCYLDRIPYHPFSLDELRDYDSVGYELMTKVWGKPEQIEKAKKADEERKKKFKK